MAQPQAITLHALGEETANGQGTGAAVADIGALRTVARLALRVLALAPGATLRVELETSPDNATWLSVWQSNEITEPTDIDVTWPELKRYLRAKWTLTGDTPGATFEFAGEAHVVYCEPKHLKRVVRAKAIEAISITDKAEACITATSRADDHFGGSFVLPLTKWGDSTIEHCGRLAVAQLFRQRGVDVNGADQIVFLAEDSSMREFFRPIREGKLKPNEIVDSSPDVFEGGAYVVTPTSRGW